MSHHHHDSTPNISKYHAEGSLPAKTYRLWAFALMPPFQAVSKAIDSFQVAHLNDGRWESSMQAHSP